MSSGKAKAIKPAPVESQSKMELDQQNDDGGNEEEQTTDPPIEDASNQAILNRREAARVCRCDDRNFDEILGLDRSQVENKKMVKDKAAQLLLKVHSDKNPNDPIAKTATASKSPEQHV